MTSPQYSHHFSINNLPFGVASSANHPEPQCVTRLENTVIFLADLQTAGIFVNVEGLPDGVFGKPTLNSFAALPKAVLRQFRSALQNRLKLLDLLPENSTEDLTAVEMHLPVSIGDFTDFSCSLHHITNAGRAIFDKEVVPATFANFPIGYTGRTSTVFISGAPIERPTGHYYDKSSPTNPKPVVFGPSKAMDYELEIGVVIGKPVPLHQRLNAKDADEHVFGLVLLNDWSARDIQSCEMVPLGPLNGKHFGTTISPWIVTLEALEPFKVPSPSSSVKLASHLDDPEGHQYRLEVQAELLTGSNVDIICSSKMEYFQWTYRHICAHQASTGCNLRTGDLLGTGTVSGPSEGTLACLLEATKNGREPLEAQGRKIGYLEDGDTIRITATAGGPSSGVGFGECQGQLRPAGSLS
jgi:fumarylacetoacetase